MAREPEEVPNDEEEGGPVKPFLDHLEDLRWTIIKSVAALVVGMSICMAAAPTLVTVLKYPLDWSGAPIELQFLGPLSGFWVSMKLAFYGGIILALPLILYFIGQFVFPALKKLEKKYFMRAIVIGAGLFLGGVALCYFVMLKISLKAVTQYNAWLNVPTEIWRAEDYFGFVSLFMMGMGLSFEMPVIVLTLVKLGVIEHRMLVKSRRYIFVINLVICAFITPDPVTTIFMVIPLQVLLEVCIWISRYWERQKKRQLAETGFLPSEANQRSVTD